MTTLPTFIKQCAFLDKGIRPVVLNRTYMMLKKLAKCLIKSKTGIDVIFLEQVEQPMSIWKQDDPRICLQPTPVHHWPWQSGGGG